MFTLSKVFTSGALFQAGASLDVKGKAAENSRISARIVSTNGKNVCSALSSTKNDGSFVITLHTPNASFDEYSIILDCAGESYTMNNVLFGELWLASGQSNMELPNISHPQYDALFEANKNKKIRAYCASYGGLTGESNFPWEPDTLADGCWAMADDYNKLSGISACGYKFAIYIYDYLNRNADTPVGILNCSWGGTSMPSWFPRDEIEKDEYITSVLKRCNIYPTEENWNTRGGCNFQQTTCQYNVKIAPVEGVKVRGVIWYQGENESGGEFWNHSYADYLRFYQRVYAKRFGAERKNFMMISSLIYPWQYGGSGECNYGYLNRAFIETAVESPNKFAFAPISDLEPVWAYHQMNHPIHPTNKYIVGARMANLALANSYGADIQKAPATLSSWEVNGNRISLHFKTDGFFLRVGDKKEEQLHGMYVAGNDGLYLPAEYEIKSPDTLDVWCDEIEEPANAAYAMQSLECKVNLFAGDYPVASFCTDTENYINIEQKQWYDTELSYHWASKMHDDVLDLFFRPLWLPMANSEVCTDTAFVNECRASVRVEAAEGNSFGCYVKSYDYNKLNFDRFSALRLSLFNIGGLSAKLVFTSAEGNVTEVPLTKIYDEKGGWARYEALGLPEGNMKTLGFAFEKEGDRYLFTNIERIRLTPKK